MKRPNVVVIVMDTARAADAGIGSSLETMPFLDRLAERGTAFTSTRANAPWTLPSHATLFSGKLTTDHGTHAGHLTFESSDTMAARLADAGYRTMAVSNNTWVSAEFGFDTGFEEFLTTWKLYQNGPDFGSVAQTRSGIVDTLRGVTAVWEGNPVKNVANLLFGQFLRRRRDDGAKRTNRLIRDRLNKDDRPLFLFVNYLEPHLPYNPPEEFTKKWLPEDATLKEARAVNQDAWAYITGEKEMDERDFRLLKALYRGELNYLDGRLAEVHDMLSQKTDRETVFFIVGDHGENIGDHGLMDHQYSLAEDLLSVPLVAVGGPFDDRGKTDSPVQIADLYPTVLDVATDELPDETAGESLCSTENLDTDRPIFAEYVTPQPSIDTLRNRYDPTKDLDKYDRALQAVHRGRYKLVRESDGNRQLYDLHTDPSGEMDVSSENPEIVMTLEELLDSRLGAPEVTKRDTRELDDKINSRLEDLGYLR